MRLNFFCNHVHKHLALCRDAKKYLLIRRYAHNIIYRAQLISRRKMKFHGRLNVNR